MSGLTLPFSSPETILPKVGGKGLNLAELARAGFPVPPGFLVTTDAYRAFVAANQIQARIVALAEAIMLDNPSSLESAAAQIGELFSRGQMPPEVAQAVRAAYHSLGTAPVAVRSSATAEDLPGLSFAGQQETYLNVVGEAAVLDAVQRCWASLWTARALGYRARNHIAPDDVALAVVVQQMVASESSGVLFTANPLTGRRAEMVIDASFGLGEAIVSGQVEPDHYVIDSQTWTISARKLGAKALVIVPRAAGGTDAVISNPTGQQALAEAQILELAHVAGRMAEHYGSPQDIEWAWAGGQLYILQSRAITSLFPVPYASFDPLVVWFSFGAVQGLVGPITPLGRDAIQHLVLGAARMLGATLKYGDIDVFGEAGERLWIKVSDVIRHPLGNRIFGGLLGFIEPSVGQILRLLAAEPRLGAGKGRLKFSTLLRLAHFLGPIAAQLARNILFPEGARARFDGAIDDYLSTAHIAPAADRFGRLANVIAFMQDRIANAFGFLMPKFIPIFGPSMAALNVLSHFSPERALEVTRGLPNNVTTEMDLALWAAAAGIQAEAESAGVFRASGAPELARRYLSGTLPPAAQSTIAHFMDRYGMRGVGEIDFGQPRWREEPTPLMHTLQSYLQIDPALAPSVQFAKGEQAAQAAIEKLSAEARRQPGGWFKEKLVRAAAARIRLLMGARESPKFFAVRTMGIARKALLEVGQAFAEAGTIERADDLVFLKLTELEELSLTPELQRRPGEWNRPAGELGALAANRNWKAIIAERRAAYEYELRRRQVPRVLVSDGRAFYEGLGAATDTGDVISGSPVSPGVVEGPVHVVLDPRDTQLAPGEILVCPGTDPAWTPLFLAAGGLITEVGGMMTHGSVVAREYGIPAVVGVHQATTRLQTGQRVRVDGNSGRITLLA